jgi:hypothetical protein
MNLYTEIRSWDGFSSLLQKQKRPTIFDENMRALSEGLKKDEHYIVRSKRLSIRSHSSFWQRIAYFFSHSREEKAVKKCISQTIRSLTETDNVPIEPLKQLFFMKMRPLSTHVFDRGAIHKKWTYLLDEDLKRTKKTPQNRDNPLCKVERRAAKTRFAVKLGIELKPINLGKSGSYLARDRKRKALGVFKPAVEESLGSQSPKLFTRMIHFARRKIFKSSAPFWKNEGYLAEVMTFQLAEHMGFHTVPASKVETLESKVFASARKLCKPLRETGSFQLFVRNAKSAEEAFHLRSRIPFFGYLLMKFNIWRYKRLILRSLKQDEFEQMALIDLTVCNRDRHFENWLLTGKKTAKRSLHLIDHQLSFPGFNPPQYDFLYQRNMHLWKHLPQAYQPFSEDMKKRAFDLLTGSALQGLLRRLSKANDPYGMGFSRPFIRQSQEEAFKQRLAGVLKAMKEGYTMRQMAERLSSAEKIVHFLTHLGKV